MSMVSVRGAITLPADTKEEVHLKTTELLKEIIKRNKIKQEDVISIVFTATKDIKSAYPAVSARALGFVNSSLMCLNEMYVENSMKMCLRVMMTYKSEKHQSEIKHVYLREAKSLRPDLSDNN